MGLMGSTAEIIVTRRLTTLVELDPDGQAVEIIGSMIDYVEISDGNSTLVERMSQYNIKIISLTVTE